MNFLILQRKQGESLIINDRTKLTYVKDRSGVAKFEITRNGKTHTVRYSMNRPEPLDEGGTITVSRAHVFTVGRQRS